MKYEYAVMKQVDGEDAVVYGGEYTTFTDAHDAMYDAEYHLRGRDGHTVRSALEARRIAIQLEEAEKTRFFVAKRQVTPWVETDSWDEK